MNSIYWREHGVSRKEITFYKKCNFQCKKHKQFLNEDSSCKEYLTPHNLDKYKLLNGEEKMILYAMDSRLHK